MNSYSRRVQMLCRVVVINDPNVRQSLTMTDSINPRSTITKVQNNRRTS
ncbi:MAG: hypothetical protein FWD61_06670 [Phycisphaerales bacterium]|nr:hypothetical protein [Phycisphaerales bacterium]